MCYTYLTVQFVFKNIISSCTHLSMNINFFIILFLHTVLSKRKVSKIINGSFELRGWTGLMFAALQINHFLPQEVAREARVSFWNDQTLHCILSKHNNTMHCFLIYWILQTPQQERIVRKHTGNIRMIR